MKELQITAPQIIKAKRLHDGKVELTLNFHPQPVEEIVGNHVITYECHSENVHIVLYEAHELLNGNEPKVDLLHSNLEWLEEKNLYYIDKVVNQNQAMVLKLWNEVERLEENLLTWKIISALAFIIAGILGVLKFTQ